jgi:imidazoleglycerol-phosphate dehydratase
MEETLRVTIGSPSENDRFLRALRETLGLDPSSPNAEVQVPATSRSASVTRATGETQIAARVDLDGKDAPSIETPIGFLSHMLHVIARHGQIDLDIRVAGDVEIDYHHTVEDTALVLGEAVRRALGDRRGVRRFGSAYVPLDESLARVVIDFSGRPFLSFEAPVDREMLLIHKDFPFALIEEFFKSFANACACNIHVDLLRGRNGHHAAEAIFKAFALALRSAKEVIADDIPSTKGVLA